MKVSKGDQGVQLMCAGVQAGGDRNRYQKAAELFKVALSDAKRTRDREEESRVLGNMGMLQWNLGDLEPGDTRRRRQLRSKATKLVKDALALATKAGDEWGQANQHSNFGVFCEDLGDNDGATRHWETAQELYDLAGLAEEAQKMERWIRGLG